LTTQENPVSRASVSVALVQRTPSTLNLLRYIPNGSEQLTLGLPESSQSGLESGPFVTLAPPQPAPGDPAINLTQPLSLTESALFRKEDPIFIRLTDLDQNLYADQIESVLVTVMSSTGDRELLRLYETGPDTGTFIGYIQTEVVTGSDNNGRLHIGTESVISVSYTDAIDHSDNSAAEGLFDPYGTVFNSLTGLPVDGVTVTLYEVNGSVRTLATVYGDDGISAYPAIVTSGGSVTDGSGRSYNFPAGGYRFPLMKTGNYQIVVTPPVGYSAPSIVATMALQNLPAATVAHLGKGQDGLAHDRDGLELAQLGACTAE
jgi:hypothetical protein